MMALPETKNQETLEPNEEALIEKIVRLQRLLHDKSEKKVRRAQHPKHHGLAKGELIVDADLSEDLKHGIFSEPGRKTVWLRFSNGRGDDDTRPTLHGLALKVTGLNQATDQDFLMVDHNVFFIKNLEEYVALFAAQVDARGGTPWSFFFPGINPLSWRIASFLRLRAVRKKLGNVLGVPYFSTTPYQLGPHAIKFSVLPLDANGGNLPIGDDVDFLGKRLAKHLKEKPASFEFRVLLRTDPANMPVEDPTVDWEKATPSACWRKVATIHLPPQATDSQQRLNLAQDMAFSPWNTLEAHRPLGGINRARRVVYEALSKDRFEANGLSGPASPTDEP
jgi:hypothetical protein